MEESQYRAIAACARFEGELEAYFEGESRPFVASHERVCSSCSALLADLQSIRMAASELALEEPSDRIWTGIRAAIEPSGNSQSSPCVQFDAELEAYMEGEERPSLVTHAQACPSCNAVLADLQTIRAVARDLPLEEPPPVVWAKIRASLPLLGAVEASACVQFGAELEAFMEGEAQPFVLSHAQNCASCGALLADLQSIRESARELPLEEPSPLVWARVRAGLESWGAFAPAACAQFDSELEAYMEEGARPFVVSHAAECAPCGALLADFQSIRQAARDLPQEEPSRVVWANVRARLEAEGAFATPLRGWRHLLLWRFVPDPAPLAVLAALVLLAALLTLPSNDLQRQAAAPESASSTAARVLLASAAQPGDDAGLAPVVSGLESSFRANEASMTPDLKATYEKSLVSLDGSIRECLDSLQQEPGNTLARDYLLAAYTRKAEVLSSALESEGR